MLRADVDVFVIGGGPAGLAAAIAARQRGFAVTVADGGEPPIDKACGEGLMPDSVEALAQLGVHLPKSAGHVLRGIRFLSEEFVAQATFASGGGVGVRRTVLHGALIERAWKAGVELRWRKPVTGIGPDGIVAGGKRIRARWIVGADGIGSRVRKWIALKEGRHHGYRYAVRQHYRIEPWSDCAEVYWGRNAQTYVTPVGAKEVCVVWLSRDARLRGDSFSAGFAQLAARLRGGEVERTQRGAITTTRQLKGVYRGRVALIGDASGSVDAITGEGLCLSFRQALALAEAMEVGDLRKYEEAHRRLARRPALMGRLLLLLDRHETLRNRAMRALASDRELFARLLAIHTGAISPAGLASTGALLGWRLVAA
jgi:flavin-dependent dehydrogenase